MLVNYSDDSTQIKKIRVLNKEAVEVLGVGDNEKTRAIMETLLELCDERLEVWISEAELRLLVDLYFCLKKACNFTDLRALTAADTGVDLFFADLRDLTRLEDVQQRGEAWLEVFRDFDEYLRLGACPRSEWAHVIAVFGSDYLLFHRQYQMMLSKKQEATTWRN